MSVEEKVAFMKSEIEGLNTRFRDHVEIEERYMTEQRVLIREIRAEQAKMKGFWGGVVFVISAMGVAAGLAFQYMSGQK